MEIGCISINLRLILLGSCVQLFDELKICCLACNTYILLDAIDYNNMSKIFVACLGLALYISHPEYGPRIEPDRPSLNRTPWDQDHLDELLEQSPSRPQTKVQTLPLTLASCCRYSGKIN